MQAPMVDNAKLLSGEMEETVTFFASSGVVMDGEGFILMGSETVRVYCMPKNSYNNECAILAC